MRISLKQILSLPESAKDIAHHHTTGNLFVHVRVFVMKAQNFPFGKVRAHFTSLCVLDIKKVLFSLF